jgi:uncharacterized protein YndB with AHSA1/START domain
MPKTEVTINRSPKMVWGYVTNKKKWKKWWGSSLKKVDPAWEEGATLVWKEGRD